MAEDKNIKFVNPYPGDTPSERLERELQTAQEQLSASPEDPALSFNLATIYLRRGRIADAIPMLEHSLRRNQNNAEGFFLLGNCYIRHDAWEMAARYYLKALRLNPDHAPALYNIGLCYATLDAKPKAINAFKKFYLLEKTPEWREETKYQLFKLGVQIPQG